VRALVLAVTLIAFVTPAPPASGAGGKSAAAGKSARSSARSSAGSSARRANPRTGRLSPAFAELVKAHKRSDRAALARVGDRMGLVRLGDATASREPGVGEAALSALPLVRGGVLLIGAAADQISVADWPRAAAAATALGALLDGAVPTALEEWEVPPDVVARACAALRALAWRSDAAVATRLAALDAVAAAAPRCGSGADLAPLARDGTPSLRRAATVVSAVGNERDTLLRDAIADADRTVSTAATAAACRIETRTGQGGKTEPPLSQALAAARTAASAPTTPPEDAVEMLDCLAAAGTPQDRALLDEIQRRPPSPLRDRAVELGVRSPPGKP
jgi:hypothetical protein